MCPFLRTYDAPFYCFRFRLMRGNNRYPHSSTDAVLHSCERSYVTLAKQWTRKNAEWILHVAKKIYRRIFMVAN